MRIAEAATSSGKLRIGIIGNGVVGHATARCYMEQHEVRVYDFLPEKRTHTFSDTVDSDLIFVCLPSPQKNDSLECDVSSITDFFNEIVASGGGRKDCNFVLRSTVPVGTTRKLREKYGLKNLIHSPEFLTARCAVTDAMLPARNIIGYPVPDFAGVPRDFEQKHQLHYLYESRFPGTQILPMTSDESESVKLFTNGFFAVKVAYFNEINLLCERLGLDWETVRAGVLSDGRIAHSHTQVPGPDGKYGFGGSCLPKDLAMLVNHLGPEGVQQVLDDEGARRVGCGSAETVCWAALERNDLDRERK